MTRCGVGYGWSQTRLNAAAAVSPDMSISGAAAMRVDAESWITRIHRAPDAPGTEALMTSMLICSNTSIRGIGLRVPYLACREALVIWHVAIRSATYFCMF